jgi:hypothetical protein
MEYNDGPKDANEPDKSTDSTQQLDAYIQDLKASQENLTWPGALRNNRGVDALFWKGNPKAPLVQRIGLMLVAVALVVDRSLDGFTLRRSAIRLRGRLCCHSLHRGRLVLAKRRSAIAQTWPCPASAESDPL